MKSWKVKKAGEQVKSWKVKTTGEQVKSWKVLGVQFDLNLNSNHFIDNKLKHCNSIHLALGKANVTRHTLKRNN